MSKRAGDILNVAKLLEAWNPFAVYGCVVTRQAVADALAANDFADFMEESSSCERPDEYHARRIAYFVKHGWDDAIEVDVGCGHWGGHFEVTDGNHRLAAAAYRGDVSIKASTAGLVDIIKQFEYRTHKKAS